MSKKPKSQTGPLSRPHEDLDHILTAQLKTLRLARLAEELLQAYIHVAGSNANQDLVARVQKKLAASFRLR